MPDVKHLSEKSDKQLVELLKDGYQKAFEELYVRHSDHLIKLCILFLKNRTDAEDIVHDVFIQIWETRDILNPELSFSGFLNKLTQNRVLQKFRKFDIHSRFIRNLLLNRIDSTNETEDAIIDSDYTKLLNELMDGLPPQQKEIFRLNRIEGLTYQEISELLQISTENVRKHVSLALKKIRKQLLRHTDIHYQSIIGILMFFS